jgi:putative transposase
VVVAFIDAHKNAFGVEPICRVLRQHDVAKIAPSTYYACKSCPPSPRSVRDEELLIEIRRVHADRKLGRGLYGAVKVWRQLHRENIAVARCTVERLMRRAGLRGVRRGRQFVTTKPDAAAPRPPDRVQRNFHAERPNALWVVDFTYVPCWSGMTFTAFVSDVFSRRIVGWRTTSSMPTALPLDALKMALWIRARGGESVDGLIHQSDAGQYTAIGLRRAAARRWRARFDRNRRGQLRQRSRRIRGGSIQDSVRAPRRPVPRHGRPRTGHRRLGVVVQPQPAPRVDPPCSAGRVRGHLLRRAARHRA